MCGENIILAGLKKILLYEDILGGKNQIAREKIGADKRRFILIWSKAKLFYRGYDPRERTKE